jgi:hypothetical protein
MTVSFIDRDSRVTPAEREGWSTFLAMPAPCMRAAREAFRQVHAGATAADALLAFVAKTGLEDDALLERMKRALEGLATERAR